MKKSLLFTILIVSTYLSFAQSYATELKKVNNYLKTFDNGYYGQLEIKDGYLYDRFKDGTNYCKGKMSEIEYAFELEKNRKVELKCKGTDLCVYSTFTGANYNTFTFSQSTDFNSSDLITLLNNLVKAYNKNPTKKNKEAEEYGSLQDDLDKYKSNIDIMNSGITSSTKQSTSGNYQTELKKLNDYLKTFDNGYYGYWEVKDGYIYDRFKAGKYNKFKMEDMEGAIIQAEYSRVIFKCKTGDCISTDWKPNGKEPYTQFTQNGAYNYKELADLLNNFRDAYLAKKKQNTSSNNSEKYTESSEFLNGYESNKDNMNSGTNKTTSSSKTTSNSKAENIEKANKALQELNNLMVTLDNGRYLGMEVTDGYIIHHYQNNQYSKAKIEDIDHVEINTQYNYAKLACKGESKCIYSTITGSYHDYFNFNASGSKLTQMEKLLNNFLTALKKCTDTNLSSSKTTSASTSRRDEEAKKRLENANKSGSNTKSEDENDFYWIDEDFDALANTQTDKKETTKSSGTTSSTSASNKYADALKKLNAYLQIYNKETYRDIEVKDNDVYFKFYSSGLNYASTISISKLKQNTHIEDYSSNTIRLKCKTGSCFWSEYSDDYADHFQFFTYSNGDKNKLKKLLQDFIAAL